MGSDSSPFLGRSAELAIVHERVMDLRLGLGSALVVKGSPGSGKSRFLSECAALVAANSVRVAMSLHGVGPTSTATAVLVDDAESLTRRQVSRLEELIAQSRRYPLLVIASISSFAFDAAALRAERWFERGASALPLHPLSGDEIELLFRALLGRVPIAAETFEEIVRVSQGNPRYAIELTQAVRSGARPDRLVPKSARMTFDFACSKLSKHSIEIVRICSVLGERFCAEWVCRIARRSTATVADALQEACDTNILKTDEANEDWYAFSDAALAKAAYDSIVSTKRTVLHQTAARRLEHSSTVDTLPLVLARQYEAVGQSEHAREYLQQAAAASMRAGSFAKAVRILVRIIPYCQVGSLGWVEASLDLVQCYSTLGQYGQLIPLCELILERVDARYHRSAAERAAWALFCAYLNNDDRGQARAIVEQLSSLSSQTAIAWLMLACAYCDAGEGTEASESLKRIDATMLVDETSRWRYAYARIVLESPHTSSMELDAVVNRAARLASRVNSHSLQCTYIAGACSALQGGDVATALKYCDRSSSLADRETGAAAYRMQTETVKARALIQFVAGDLLNAKRNLVTNVSWHDSGIYNESLHAGMAVFVGMRTLDSALVHAFFEPRLLQRAVEMQHSELIGILLYGFADAMVARSMEKELYEYLRDCITRDTLDPYFFIPLTAARVLPITDLPAVYKSLECETSATGTSVRLAHSSLVRAVIEHRLGPKPLAAAHARIAAGIYQRLEWRLSEALAREIAGESLMAAEIYSCCGAVAEAKRILSGQKRKSKYAPFGASLTRKEGQVASLIARDFADRTIADALGISVRTVHHHVEAILSKLGIANRSLVANALSRGDAPPVSAAAVDRSGSPPLVI